MTRTVPGERRGFAHTRHGNIEYRERGSGPTLIMLHNTPYSSARYSTLMPALEDALHCVAISTPGYGESDRPPTPYETVAVRAHGALSPVGQLVAPSESPASKTNHKVQRDEVQATEVLTPRSVANDVARPTTANIRPPAEEATIRSAMRPGVTLVAKYKGREYRCDVVGQNDVLRYVLPGGRTFKSPSAAGRAITGNQVNGYRFWTVVEGPPSACPNRR